MSWREIRITENLNSEHGVGMSVNLGIRVKSVKRIGHKESSRGSTELSSKGNQTGEDQKGGEAW